MITNSNSILLISSARQISDSATELCDLMNADIEIKSHSSDSIMHSLEKQWDLVMIEADKQIASIFETCRQIKSRRPLCQIIVIAPVSNPQITAGCLNNGADDVLVHPWSPIEAFARTTVAINRGRQVAALFASRAAARTDPEKSPNQIPDQQKDTEVKLPADEVSEYRHAGDVRICQLKREVSVLEEVLQVTRTEYLLLSYLMHNIDRPCSSAELLLNVMGYDDDSYLPSLHSHVSRLRRKIKASHTTTIETIWCFGYRILTRNLSIA